MNKSINTKNKKSVSDILKDNKLRILVIGVSLALFIFLYIYANNILPSGFDIIEEESLFVKGTVVEVLEDNTMVDENYEGLVRGSQELEIEITSGTEKGNIYQLTNYIGDLYQTYSEVGTKLILKKFVRQDGTVDYGIYSYDRSGFLITAILIFVVILSIIGGRKGIRAVVALAFTLFCVFMILLPGVYYGSNVLLTTMLIILLTTVFSFAVIDGVNIKTICATTGTLIGVLVAGLFTIISEKVAHVSGLTSTEAEELLLTGRQYGLEIRHLFTAGILISAMGAVMDVAMSISSAIHEMFDIDNSLTARKLFTSGMNIGKDAMGTMANTLILAFAGSSLTLVVLLYSYNIPFIRLVNTDFVVMEVIQGIAGSLGIIIAVPAVAMIGSVTHIKFRKK